ncbi:hypothetical protein BGZ73_001271 [Actinomortierella ambigua]|nr:hypothetical protein BGZ73_001271 [Actinomortierella ambigua]
MSATKTDASLVSTTAEITTSPTKAVKIAEDGIRVKRLSLLTPDDLRTPLVAWPTIAVSAGSLAVWASVLYYGAHKRMIPAWLSFPVMTAAIFASFTPVHDATHYSVAKGKFKVVVNELIGTLSGIPLMLPFGAYRQLHLQHHRYVNIPDKDPDHWDATGPNILRPFKWFFPDVFWVKDAMMGRVKQPQVFQGLVFYAFFFAALRKMHQKDMAYVKYWLAPMKMAHWLLVWLFAYVPHKMGEASGNIYKTTSVTGGVLRSDGLNLAIPLLNQHLHNIHHLYPQLPFTHYSAIWRKHKDALIRAGTETHPVYSHENKWL